MQQQMWVVYAEAIAELFACHLNDDDLAVMQRVLRQMLGSACEQKAEET
jgi:hypothetical protein